MAQSSVVTIGVFDGVHRGHAALLETVVGLARTEGMRAAVVTFDPHPMSVVRGQRIPMLTTPARRTRLLRQRGIEDVRIVQFDTARSQQTAEDFVTEVLGSLEAAIVVVGEGFRFGKGAIGTAETLRDAGLIVHEAPTVASHDQRVSSTRIRGALAEGDVALAQQLLGRPHRVEGVVVHGNARGRELGYPTANLAVVDGLLVPADGVYAGWLVRGEVAHGFDGDELLPAAISIGSNPTFGDVDERRVEAYVLDRSDLDLYGEYLAFDFHERIRGTAAFPALSSLLEAMADDVDRARNLLT